MTFEEESNLFLDLNDILETLIDLRKNGPVWELFSDEIEAFIDSLENRLELFNK